MWTPVGDGRGYQKFRNKIVSAIKQSNESKHLNNSDKNKERYRIGYTIQII